MRPTDRSYDRYQLEVRYEYWVNGRRYVTDVWRFGAKASSFSKAEATEIVSQYAGAHSLTVFYNPDNPDEAVLEPGETDMGVRICGGIFILVGLIWFLVSYFKS